MTSSLHASPQDVLPQAKSSYSLSDFVQSCCVTMACLWVVSPPLFGNGMARIVALLAIVLWFAIEVIKHPETFLRPTWVTLIVIFYGGYVNAASYFVDGTSDLLRNFNLNFLLFCLLVFESHRRRDLDKLKWPALIVSLTSIIWMVATLSAMERQRNVARLITRVSEESVALQNMGVGGFALVYFACALIPALVYLVRNGAFEVRWVRLAGCVLLGLSVILVVRGGYFIALITGSAAIIASLFFVRPTLRSITQALLALGIVATVGYIFAPYFTESGVELADGTMYEQKVEDSLEFLSSKETGSSFEGRGGRYMRSLTLFSENPLIGVISVRDVGKHSQLLDNFARYGILIGGLLPLMFILTGKSLIARFRGTGAVPLVAVTLLLGLALALFNNIAATLGIAVFIIMPAVGEAISRSERALSAESP